MDRLDAMATFVAVADLRAFAAAARQRGLSRPAVTRQVAALEAHLGVRLLSRTTRRVALTEAGARYLTRARRLLADVAEAEGVALADQGAPAGRLVVAAPNLFGRQHVAPLMCAFLARHPALLGELLLADRAVSLVEEGVDVAVRIGHVADAGLMARPVGRTRRVVVGAPAYLRRRGTPRRPEELARHDLISFTGVSPGPEWRFRRDGAEVRVALVPRFVTNSADAALGHAGQGGGLTMVLAYQASEALRAGRLQVVLAGFERPPLAIQLVTPAGRLPSAAVKAFAAQLAETCDWEFTAP